MKSLLALLILLLVISPRLLPGQNVIPNGDFEADFTGWTPDHGATISNSTVHAGSKSLLISDSLAEAYSYSYQELYLDYGAHEISFWVYPESETYSSAFELISDWPYGSTVFVTGVLMTDSTLAFTAVDDNETIPYHLAKDAWNNITIRVDERTLTQNFYVNGRLVSTLSPSSFPTIEHLLVGDLSKSDMHGSLVFDDISIIDMTPFPVSESQPKPRGQLPASSGDDTGVGDGPQPDAQPSRPLNKPYKVVEVFYATDRKHTGSTDPYLVYGPGKDVLKYGRCFVTIPPNHKLGFIESPSIFRFELNEDANKHFVLWKVLEQESSVVFNDLSARVNESPSKSALVFVHGFNVSFSDAAKRTAQLADDLDFKGAPVFYSWPSNGSVSKYEEDEEAIELTMVHLEEFFLDFFTQSTAENIYLIAHSMGNRAVTRVIADVLTERPEFRSRLKEIILAAPDIDAMVFKEEIVPKLVSLGRPVTLYASSSDRALQASKLVHEGRARAGDAGDDLVVTPGIETIDATLVSSGFLGHSYFSDDRSIVTDISYIIGGERPDRRFGLELVRSSLGRYWRFKE